MIFDAKYVKIKLQLIRYFLCCYENDSNVSDFFRSLTSKRNLKYNVRRRSVMEPRRSTGKVIQPPCCTKATY